MLITLWLTTGNVMNLGLSIGITSTQRFGPEPPSLSSYSTDFSEYALGVGVPTGWAEAWVPELATYGIETDPENPSAKRLTSNWVDKDFHALTYDGVEDMADVDLTMLHKHPEQPVTINTHLYLVGREQGTGDGQIKRSYQMSTAAENNAVSLYKWIQVDPGDPFDGQVSLIGSPFSKRVDKKYWYRFNILGSGPVILKGKIWMYGTPEPSEWTIEFSDTTDLVTGPGKVGLGGYYNSEIDMYDWAVDPVSAVPTTSLATNSTAQLLTSPGGETGDTTGWVGDVGTPHVLTDADYGKVSHTGVFHLCATDVAQGQTYVIRQRIHLVNDGSVPPGEITSGTAIATFRAHQMRYSGSYSDEGRIGIRFLDGALAPISIEYSLPNESSDGMEWWGTQVYADIPVNAVYADFIYEADKVNSGTGITHHYFDSMEAFVSWP